MLNIIFKDKQIMTVREIRKNPFTNEWIIYSETRQSRPDREEGFCPLCTGSEEVPNFNKPLRIPNKFPALNLDEQPKKRRLGEFELMMNGYGKCELIIYTDIHNAKFVDLNNEEIMDIFEQWMNATKELSSNEQIQYILPFENYGPEVGATLIHPHGQLYAYPFVPNSISIEMDSIIKYQEENNSCMVCDYILSEIQKEKRIVYQDSDILCLVPYFARYAYDLFIYPKRHVNFLHQCTRTELNSIITCIRNSILALNEVFQKEVSYSLSLHQAPVNVKGTSNYHLYFKVHTPQRNLKSQKLLGAVETSTMTYINGTLPETAALNLRKYMESQN